MFNHVQMFRALLSHRKGRGVNKHFTYWDLGKEEALFHAWLIQLMRREARMVN